MDAARQLLPSLLPFLRVLIAFIEGLEQPPGASPSPTVSPESIKDDTTPEHTGFIKDDTSEDGGYYTLPPPPLRRPSCDICGRRRSRVDNNGNCRNCVRRYGRT